MAARPEMSVWLMPGWYNYNIVRGERRVLRSHMDPRENFLGHFNPKSPQLGTDRF